MKEESMEKMQDNNLKLNNITIQKLPPFKASNAKKLETILEPNTEYTITHLDTAHHRNSKQYVIELKEYPDEIINANQCLSNAFKEIPQLFILKFKTLTPKI